MTAQLTSSRTQLRAATFLVPDAVLIVVAVFVGHHWSWPLFVWGAVLGPIGVVWARVQTELLTRRSFPPSAERDAAIRAFRRHGWRRWAVTYLSMVVFGVAIGAVSARMNSTVPDIIATAGFVLTFGLSILVSRAAYRRLRAAAAPENAAD